jgi:M6 family metalloprotease-like protein
MTVKNFTKLVGTAIITVMLFAIGSAMADDGPREVVGLTILVDFPDRKLDATPEMVDELLNRPGGIGGNSAGGSVFDYFYEASGGRLRYTNIVTPFFITAEHEAGYYDNVFDKSRELVTYALNQLAAHPEFDFSGITVENGAAVALSIVYPNGGPGSHASANLSPVTIGGITFNKYQMTQFSNSPFINTYTFVHEIGHLLFGWSDLFAPVAVARRYCIMTGDFLLLSPPNPFFRDLAGWMDITDITNMSDTVLTITANSNQAYYFSRNGIESYYIEARRHTSTPARLPGEGLIIWHIHRGGQNPGGSTIPFPMVKVVRANYPGSTAEPFPPEAPNDYPWADAPFRADGGSNNTTFSATSSPAAIWFDGTPSDINITEISAVGDVMTFRFTNPNPTCSKEDNVPYIDENGITQTANGVTVIDNNNINRIGDLNGWYLVRGNLERDVSFWVSGEAHIILENGSDLTVTGSDRIAGIGVSTGNSLAIYAQSTDESIMGELTAAGSDNAAGIGGSSIGLIGFNDFRDCGTVIINGGMITAIGGDRSAGIGGGGNTNVHGGVASGNIIINGGTVIATGGSYGAGIGGGMRTKGGIITIRGGIVTATGGSWGAGIGGGHGGSGGDITISGGTITTTGGNVSAGIGGGGSNMSLDAAGSGGNITISGGTVTATGGNRGAGIGGSMDASGGIITITDGTITATGLTAAAGIGGGGSSGSTGTPGNGGTVTINGGVVTANGSSNGNDRGAGIGAGSSGVDGGTLKMNGNAVIFATSLINNSDVEADTSGNLTNGILFVANPGIFYGESVTITQNVTMPANHTLTIPEEATLTIPFDRTFTNNGTLTNDGTILVCGELTGNAVIGNEPVESDACVVAILAIDREIPIDAVEETAVVTPVMVLTGEFTVGPNPVSRLFGKVNFYWNGRRVNDGVLTVFDASGNVVSRVTINDCADCRGVARNALTAGSIESIDSRRAVGTWDLTDIRGRLVSEGTYLVRGTVTTSDGKRERVSVIVGVR